MPVFNSKQVKEAELLEGTVEETDDFKQFVANLTVAKQSLLPLEQQRLKNLQADQKLIEEFLEKENLQREELLLENTDKLISFRTSNEDEVAKPVRKFTLEDLSQEAKMKLL